jgi:hypothetical protein
MGNACGTYWRDEKCIQILVGKPEEKIPLERQRHRRGDNVETNLEKTGYEGVY